MTPERLADLDRTPRPVGLWESWETDPWAPGFEEVEVGEHPTLGRYL